MPYNCQLIGSSKKNEIFSIDWDEITQKPVDVSVILKNYVEESLKKNS